MHYHKWSYSDIENMIPWEKNYYVDKLIVVLEKERKDYEEKQREFQGRVSL